MGRSIIWIPSKSLISKSLHFYHFLVLQLPDSSAPFGCRVWMGLSKAYQMDECLRIFTPSQALCRMKALHPSTPTSKSQNQIQNVEIEKLFSRTFRPPKLRRTESRC
ncbi:hypothetical protein OCU04_006088 [Sclerotinia nivalis]|uniref:Uncharacterized protein n=1 Tax=Sclerotinia nivalis TaxID=352851 RepID=A0A9X0DK69_9HELO|nr:hypothetical protein OCU04_006088 [Sclerotinia nivalis]